MLPVASTAQGWTLPERRLGWAFRRQRRCLSWAF